MGYGVTFLLPKSNLQFPKNKGIIAYMGKHYSLTNLENYEEILEKCRRYKVGYSTLRSRLLAGWEVDKACTLEPWSREAKAYAQQVRNGKSNPESNPQSNARTLPIKGFIW